MWYILKTNRHAIFCLNLAIMFHCDLENLISCPSCPYVTSMQIQLKYTNQFMRYLADKELSHWQDPHQKQCAHLPFGVCVCVGGGGGHNYFMTNLCESYVTWLGFELETPGLKLDFKSEKQPTALPCLATSQCEQLLCFLMLYSTDHLWNFKLTVFYRCYSQSS